MIFISLFPQGFFFPAGGSVFLFELTFPFNIYHSGLLKCCFSAEAACKLFGAAAFLEVCYLRCVIPLLNHPILPLLSDCAGDPCTAQHASGRAGVRPRPPVSSCFMSAPGGVFPVCCRNTNPKAWPVSSVLSDL